MQPVIIKQATTTSVEGEPWVSPDGQVKIWKVKIETPDGNRDLYSTMSAKIANVGWSGDLEMYTNTKGKVYIRQAPKEDAPRKSDKYDSAGQKHGNALKIAADFYLARGVQDMDENQYVEAVESLAKRIFAIQVPTVVTETPSLKDTWNQTQAQKTTGITNPELNSLASTYGQDVVADVPDEPISLDDIPF